MWRSVRELDGELQSLAELPRLERLYALSTLWRNAVYSDDYRANDEWPNFLKLTDYGKMVLDLLGPLHDKSSEADMWLALFGKFFHHDLFFDWRDGDETKIRETIQRELFAERIRIPHRFGRLLYDRFNDTYVDTRTDHLMSSEVQRLLQGTPQGIYQLGRLVTGPLGVLDSQEARYIPPELRLPLWHCSDTGCNAIHEVRLLPPGIPLVQIYSSITKVLSDNFGPPSEWNGSLISFHRGSRPRLPRPFVDLPVIVGDCIVGDERTALLELALHGPSGNVLRECLAKPPRKKHDAEGPALEVARRLSTEAQLQLLLVLADREVVNLIDEVIYSKKIRIPLGEIRRLNYYTPRRSKDTGSHLSALGIRSTRDDPLANLTSAIWRAYQGAGLINELEWRVRSDSSRSAHEALVAFIRNHGPAETTRELILSSGGITKAVCEDLRIPLQQAISTENLAVDRLLWKLGFNPMQFDDSVQRFKLRLIEFNETILANTPVDNEDARERIRAAGVNVFVSVEDFVDRLISYNTWLLSTDHFLENKFQYCSDRARRSVVTTLGATLNSGTVTVSWCPDGENDLGTLLRYLRATVDWIQGLSEQDRAPLVRAETDLPHFADDERIRFPFRHVVLWADADPTELRKYGQLLSNIVKLIEESELPRVRNGLDHFRDGDRFPTADKMLACVARITQAVELADIHRYLPKVFWLFRRQGNRFGLIEYEFRDYAGRTILVYGPPLISGLARTLYQNAYLVAPGNLLGMPNSTLIFQVREESLFLSYWRDYPRRRRIAEGADDNVMRTADENAQNSLTSG